MVGFDVETTSPEPEDARIVSVALVEVGGGQPTMSRTWLVDPGVEIPEEAAAIHGITTERARADGQDPAVAVVEVVKTLVARPAGAAVVIFNARFDLTVLDREARRHGLGPLDEYPELRPPQLLVVDPLVLDKWLHRYRKGSRRLDAQAEHYQAKLDDAHDAASDALAAARVAWCIGQRGQVIRRVRNSRDGRDLAVLNREWQRVRDDLPALHLAQMRWAREQAVSLAEYFREKGEPQDVPAAWPLIPAVEVAA